MTTIGPFVVEIDASAIDEAQVKADILLSTLREIKETQALVSLVAAPTRPASFVGCSEVVATLLDRAMADGNSQLSMDARDASGLDERKFEAPEIVKAISPVTATGATHGDVLMCAREYVKTLEMAISLALPAPSPEKLLTSLSGIASAR